MKVKRVIYSAVVSLGNYENEKIGMAAALEDGDSPEEVIQELKKRSIALAGPSAQKTWEERYKLERTFEQLRQQVVSAKAEYESVAAFLKAQGIKDMTEFPQLKLLGPASQFNIESEKAEIIETDEDEEDYDRDDDEE